MYIMITAILAALITGIGAAIAVCLRLPELDRASGEQG